MTEQPYTIEHYDTRADWLRARKRGLGASDAAPVLGMGRFRGAYSVATDKLTEAIDDSQDEVQEWGLRHEPAIAQKFSEVMADRGFSISDPGQFTIFRSKERPHLFCTPDRLVTELGVMIAELSLKCAWFDAAKEWKQRIPLEYQIQGSQTIYVLGMDLLYYAVLLEGCHFRWHSLKRHEAMLSRMLPKLDAFWESINRGEYPNVDGSEATARSLAMRYATPTAGLIELDEELLALGDEYDQILERGRKDEKRQLAIQNRIKEALGDKTVGVLPDQSGFGWKMNGKGSRRFQRIAKVREVDG
jgi:predicted phage-related endonuclease